MNSGWSVQAELGLSDIEEVEDWVVKAMGKKLMGGQMDQVSLVWCNEMQGSRGFVWRGGGEVKG